MAIKPECCPTCKRPYNLTVPRKICWKCKKKISVHHKYRFTDKGRVEHRNCNDPESYT